jgi:putative salt-induced outer membrane protein
MSRAFVLFVWFCVVSVFAVADQVTLKNGDHLTGTIAKSDGKTLTLKTDAMGSVDIQFTAIKDFSSEKPLYVQTTSTKQTYNGTVNTTDDSLAVVTSPTQTVTVAKSDMAAIRSPEEQTAYEKAQHPGLLQGWTGGANIGFGLTAGNSETESLALGFSAVRAGLHDKISMYATSVYSRNNAPGATPAVTANTDTGGIRYDHDLNPKIFAFVTADFMADELQDLNLRSVFGGGLGYHLIKRDTTTLDLLAGITYTRENYSTFTRNFPAALAGEELMHKFGKSTVATQKAYFFPDLSDLGEYRTEFDLGTVTKISKWFGWQNTFSDIYVTNPPPLTKRNDIIFATGINVSFTH